MAGGASSSDRLVTSFPLLGLKRKLNRTFKNVKIVSNRMVFDNDGRLVSFKGHMGDPRMSDGLNYETQISIGFLNDNVEKSLETYRKAFDVVYLNDAPMWGALELVFQLFPTEAS